MTENLKRLYCVEKSKIEIQQKWANKPHPSCGSHYHMALFLISHGKWQNTWLPNRILFYYPKGSATSIAISMFLLCEWSQWRMQGKGVGRLTFYGIDAIFRYHQGFVQSWHTGLNYNQNSKLSFRFIKCTLSSAICDAFQVQEITFLLNNCNISSPDSNSKMALCAKRTAAAQRGKRCKLFTGEQAGSPYVSMAVHQKGANVKAAQNNSDLFNHISLWYQIQIWDKLPHNNQSSSGSKTLLSTLTRRVILSRLTFWTNSLLQGMCHNKKAIDPKR